jgi:hypothetical protein
MKLKLTSLLLAGCLAVLAQTAAQGQNVPVRSEKLDLLTAGNLVNTVCGSSRKCWVVHVKNSGKESTPKGTAQIDFDYYTGPQDAPLQPRRLTAKGTVPVLQPGSDVWVRVMLDAPPHQAKSATGVKVVNASHQDTTRVVSNMGRSTSNPETSAALNEVVSGEIPTNYRGLTVSIPFNANALQQGQPFTHELTCDLRAHETSAAIKNGKIQIKIVLNNLGYAGTCSAAGKFTFVMTFGYGWVLEAKPFFIAPAVSPKTDPASWGQSVNSFEFECNAFCQQHCLFSSSIIKGQLCVYHIDLINGMGNKQSFGDWKVFPHAEPGLGH